MSSTAKKSLEGSGGVQSPTADGRKDSFGEGDEHEYQDYDEEEAEDVTVDDIAAQKVVSDRRSDSGDDEFDEDDGFERGAEGPKIDQETEKSAGKLAVVNKKDMTGYKIRPNLDEKFRPGVVQVLIEKVIRDHLDGQAYITEEMPKLVKVMTDEIQQKVKAQKYKRYKLVTYVSLGERRGEGVSSATRCIWDAESDCMATYTFLNETIFCCATVYGVYFY